MLAQLRNALYAAMIITYAQGMAQLRRASEAYGYGLNLEDVARIWRGGCIIRAALLEEIRGGLSRRPDLPNLLVDPHLAKTVLARQEDLRAVVQVAAELAVPAPGLMVSLAYFDSYRSAVAAGQPDRGPARLLRRPRLRARGHATEGYVPHRRWERMRP